MKNHFIVLDVETGGMEEDKNPITELALQVLDPVKFKEIHRYQTYVKPYANLTILKEALAKSRVSMKEIEAGVDVSVMVAGLIKATKVANPSGKAKPILVGHNISFDKKFLEFVFKLKGKNVWDYFDEIPMCTMRLMKNMETGKLKADEVSRYTLTSCAERLGIKLKSAHGAMSDVEATTKVFKALILMMRNAEVGKESGSPEESQKTRKTFQFVEFH